MMPPAASEPHPFHLASISGAVLSDDQRHRYWLWRIWDRARPLLIVCMFNPSTADARKDDPTIKRLCGWATRWGYGGLLVINLYSLRSSDPALIRGQERAAFGAAQIEAWNHALDLAKRQKSAVLCAWGDLADQRAELNFKMAAEGLPLICLGLTRSGRPIHPMARGRSRVPDNQEPIDFAPG